MKILFLGDVMGRAGRKAVLDHLPRLRADRALDFVVINAENSASGFGMTARIAESLFEAGADVITLGDHCFDQKEMLSHIQTDPRILRPLNFAKGAPGRGAGVFGATRGRKVFVAVALGRVFMNRPFDDPFSALDAAMKQAPLGGVAQASVVEIHAEATSEKMGVGHWCDGRASLVVGTHTHVPTADTMILPKGTAYQSDAGMCGDYNSVIGMDKTEPLNRFVTGMGNQRFEPALGEATLSGVLVVTDDATGLARSAEPVRIGGRLFADRLGQQLTANRLPAKAPRAEDTGRTSCNWVEGTQGSVSFPGNKSTCRLQGVRGREAEFLTPVPGWELPS